MHFYVLILVAIAPIPTFAAFDHHDARRQCDNLHHSGRFRPTNRSDASSRNCGCRLVCTLMNQAVVYTAHINQDQPCPEDATGICHDGECLKTELFSTNTSPTTMEPFRTARPLLGYYNLSMLVSMNTRILEAHLWPRHRNTYGVVCLVSTEDSSIQDCREICRTNISTELTTVPVWNHQCPPLRAMTPTDFVLMGIWSRDHDVPISYNIHPLTTLLEYNEYNRTSGIVFNYSTHLMRQTSFRLLLHTEYHFRPGGLH